MTVEIIENPVRPERKRQTKYPWATIKVGGGFRITDRTKKLIVPKWTKPRKYSQYLEGGSLLVIRDE